MVTIKNKLGKLNKLYFIEEEGFYMEININYNLEIDTNDLVHPYYTSGLIGVVVSGIDRDGNHYNVISQDPDTGCLFLRHNTDITKQELNEQYVYIGQVDHMSVNIVTASKLTKDDMLNVYSQVEKSIYEGHGDSSDYSGMSSEFDNIDE